MVVGFNVTSGTIYNNYIKSDRVEERRFINRFLFFTCFQVTNLSIYEAILVFQLKKLPHPQQNPLIFAPALHLHVCNLQEEGFTQTQTPGGCPEQSRNKCLAQGHSTGLWGRSPCGGLKLISGIEIRTSEIEEESNGCCNHNKWANNKHVKRLGISPKAAAVKW